MLCSTLTQLAPCLHSLVYHRAQLLFQKQNFDICENKLDCVDSSRVGAFMKVNHHKQNLTKNNLVIS